MKNILLFAFLMISVQAVAVSMTISEVYDSSHVRPPVPCPFK